MPFKRPLDIYDSPASSTPPRPIKRRHLSTPTSSPARFVLPPSDSPTNPFGLKRCSLLARSSTLPPASSFSKHLPLRFQLVGAGDREGAWRIVQVPLNYTFRHLHRLILFLFGGGPDAPVKGRGHLFEAHKRVIMYHALFKPGRIRFARTWAKLSSVRDPFRNGAAADEAAEEECEDGEWHWEAEEDLTLAHIWPKGGDLSRAITYHHDTALSVHITLNTVEIPRRKGSGNKPYVFSARGDVSLPELAALSPISAGAREFETVPTSTWNRPEAFEDFLKSFHTDPEPEPEDDDDDDDELDANASMSSSFSDPFTPVTPFPATPLHARRVENSAKRLTRLAKRGMEAVGSDEDEDEEDQLQDEGVDLLQEEEELCR